MKSSMVVKSCTARNRETGRALVEDKTKRLMFGCVGSISLVVKGRVRKYIVKLSIITCLLVFGSGD